MLTHLLDVLEANGAGRPEGWQVRQDELAELAGFKQKRKLYEYLVRAKRHGLIVVTASQVSTGSGWGHTARAPDRYHLKVTSDEWLEMRDEVVGRVLAERDGRISASRRAAEMEKSRKVRAAERVLSRPGAARGAAMPAAVSVGPDTEAIAERVAQMGDEDLKGW